MTACKSVHHLHCIVFLDIGSCDLCMKAVLFARAIDLVRVRLWIHSTVSCKVICDVLNFQFEAIQQTSLFLTLRSYFLLYSDDGKILSFSCTGALSLHLTLLRPMLFSLFSFYWSGINSTLSGPLELSYIKCWKGWRRHLREACSMNNEQIMQFSVTTIYPSTLTSSGSLWKGGTRNFLSCARICFRQFF